MTGGFSHEASLKIRCTDPESVKRSLEPDIRDDSSSRTAVKADRKAGMIIITVKSEKLSHMKAIINSYLGIVAMLNESDKAGSG